MFGTNGTLVKRVNEKDLLRKRPLDRPNLGWEDGVKREVERIELGIKWSGAVEDRDRWQSLTLSVWT